MKLICYKYKDGIYLDKKVLFTDIPTLGIAFTCIDNYCSDNGRNPVNFNNLEIATPIVSIWVTTIKNNQATDDYDILFEIV